MLLTNNPLLISSARKNYDKFLVPTNLVESTKSIRYYTPEQQADLDIKTSVNKIGEIVNLSQELQTLMWHKLNNGSSFEDIRELYYDICQLDVMSGLEIDYRSPYSVSCMKKYIELLELLKISCTTA